MEQPLKTSQVTDLDAERRTTDRRPSQGAEALEAGVRYRTWCEHDSVEALVIDQQGQVLRTVLLEAEGDGYFSGLDQAGRAGDLYRYRLAGTGDWPDPASRFQPQGVHGPSMVVDPKTFRWTDESWKAPPYRDLVIYELHVGTFTDAGTFRAVIEKLDYFVELGVNAIEIMPVADFPGERNWGYDGVSLYAPSRAYGTPDDFRALIDAAHAQRLTVILDVVYNHFGPDGNYVGVYHKGYFNPAHQTPWGAGLNYEHAAVRDFFSENALYWMREFHIDGFRLDATHAILDDSEQHILAEIAERVHAAGGFVIAEDDRNDPTLLRAPDAGGFGFDGCWSDDFHHTVRVMLTKQREGYYANFEGTPRELADTLAHGWHYRGQPRLTSGKPRGAESIALAPEQFVYCISNHDQVGNRAFGERLGHVIDPAAYRAASALLCLVPYTPMLFMGQEWAASTPFQFFTDHNAELGKLVTEGRRKEFQNFPAFADPKQRERIPDPQAVSTFQSSKLRWDELREEKHAQMLLLYQEFLGLRTTHASLRNRSRDAWMVTELNDGIVALLYDGAGEFTLGVLVDLIGGHSMPNIDDARIAPGGGRDWKPLLSSNESRFGGNDEAFSIPTVLVLEAI